MVPAMLTAIAHAATAAMMTHVATISTLTSGDVAHPASLRPVPLARLPLAGSAGWAMRRCGGDRSPGAMRTASPDPACVRLTIRDESVEPGERLGRLAASSGGGSFGGGDGAGWRLAGALLPALGGVAGPGGMGLGIGGGMPLVRGARMDWHLAAPHDTRIAPTRFAPETTVQARCAACWDEGEALGAGINGGRRGSDSK